MFYSWTNEVAVVFSLFIHRVMNFQINLILLYFIIYVLSICVRLESETMCIIIFGSSLEIKKG